MKILIAGAGGLVGQALTEHCINKGDEVFAYAREDLDITDTATVLGKVTKDIPHYVINCAAWTDVDGCESDRERSHSVNALGPANLAAASQAVNAGFITISTDYVFDGTKQDFYTQRDDPNPLSVYAKSKLEGERLSQLQYARTIVVRSGYIFGKNGKNFLSTVVDRVARGETPKAIVDSWGTPTYANHLAARLRELANLDLPGIFHVVNSGDGATFESFTRRALELAGYDPAKIEAVAFHTLKRPAPRPRNSRLKCLFSEALRLTALPHWEVGLRAFIESSRSERLY